VFNLQTAMALQYPVEKSNGLTIYCHHLSEWSFAIQLPAWKSSYGLNTEYLKLGHFSMI
jgi:hypothetical protein